MKSHASSHALAFCLSTLLLAGVTRLSGQEAPTPAETQPQWELGLVSALKFTQTYFDNWAKGGVDALTGQLNIDGVAERNRDQDNWRSTGKIAYGITRIDDEDPRKSTDEFRFETVYTRKLGLWVNPYVAATANSQFTPGYEYGPLDTMRISGFFDPAFFTQSIGFGWTPYQPLRTRLGFALKETWSRDFAARYVDETGDNFKIEPGMEFVAGYAQTLLGNLLISSDLVLFSNFKAVDEIDGRWDNSISAKINRFIDVSLNLEILYDKDISESRQVKQSLALGLTYAFL